MATMDDILDRAGSAAHVLASATRRTAHLTKLSVRIAAEEDKIRTAQQAIGSLCYEAAKAGRTLTGPEIDSLIRQIDQSKAQIRKLRELKNSGTGSSV